MTPKCFQKHTEMYTTIYISFFRPVPSIEDHVVLEHQSGDKKIFRTMKN